MECTPSLAQPKSFKMQMRQMAIATLCWFNFSLFKIMGIIVYKSFLFIYNYIKIIFFISSHQNNFKILIKQ